MKPFRPQKRLGQHFLKSRSIALKMAERLRIQEKDRILEIGPGDGILTAALLEKPAEKIVGVEIDPILCGRLKDRFRHDDRFELFEGDFLSQDLGVLMEGAPFRIVGNIPYAITSPILFKTLDSRELVTDTTLMVQKEVGERLVCGPGSKAYGIPSVIFQLFAEIELWFSVSRKSFYPVPGVDSVVVSLRFFDSPRFHVDDLVVFKDMVKTVFSQRRKMLRNSLKTILGEEISIDRLSVDGRKRPEELSVEQFAQLANEIVSSRRTRGREVG